MSSSQESKCGCNSIDEALKECQKVREDLQATCNYLTKMKQCCQHHKKIHSPKVTTSSAIKYYVSGLKGRPEYQIVWTDNFENQHNKKVQSILYSTREIVCQDGTYVSVHDSEPDLAYFIDINWYTYEKYVIKKKDKFEQWKNEPLPTVWPHFNSMFKSGLLHIYDLDEDGKKLNF